MKNNQMYITSGVNELISGDHSLLAPIIEKFLSKNWGELNESDKLENDNAFLKGGSIIAKYLLNCEFVYIIRDADLSATTVLLPSEY